VAARYIREGAKILGTLLGVLHCQDEHSDHKNHPPEKSTATRRSAQVAAPFHRVTSITQDALDLA
jgi:hypothetical protein